MGAVIRNIHCCNRYLFVLGLLCSPFSFSRRTGGSLLRLRVNKWTILSHPAFFILEVFAMRRMPIIHFLDHDYNFLFCNWNTEDDLLFLMDFLCLSGFCPSAELSLLTSLLGRCPLLCSFFAVSCSKEHFPPSNQKPFDVKARQYVPLCSALLKSKRLVLGLLNALFELQKCSAFTAHECY